MTSRGRAGSGVCQLLGKFLGLLYGLILNLLLDFGAVLHCLGIERRAVCRFAIDTIRIWWGERALC